MIDADTGLVTWANFRDFLIKDIELDFIDAQTDIFRGIWKSLTEHAGANINQNFHISHCGCALRSKSIGGSDYRSIAIEPDGLIAVFINKDIFRIKVNPKGARLNSGALVGDNATPKQKSMTLGAVSFYRESITKFCEALKLEIENPVTTIDLI